MLTRTPHKVLFHNVPDDWPHLKQVPGIDKYWNRAMMMAGDNTTVVMHGKATPDLMALIQHYKQIGLRVALYHVPRQTDSLYADALQDPQLLRMLRKHGNTVDFFSTSPAMTQFVRDARIPAGNIANVNREHYLQLSDKAALRQMLNQIGQGHLCPPNEVVTTHDELYTAMGRLKRDNPTADGLVIKLPDRASSEGMVFLARDETPQDFLQQYWPNEGDPLTVIVEVAYEHFPFSITVDIDDQEWTLSHYSLQWMGNHHHSPFVPITLDQMRRGDMAHRANVTGPLMQDLGPLPVPVLCGSLTMLAPFLRHLHQMGVRGTVGLDMLYATNARKAFLLEANARTGHSRYVQFAMASLAKHYRTPLYAIGANVHDVCPTVRGFTCLQQRVPNVLNGTPHGVTPFHTALLKDGRKCGLLAVSTSIEKMWRHFQQAQDALMPQA